jgi:hypothetical protein
MNFSLKMMAAVSFGLYVTGSAALAQVTDGDTTAPGPQAGDTCFQYVKLLFPTFHSY